MTFQEELAQVAEKHARQMPVLANCEVQLKMHQAECREVWVTMKTKRESGVKRAG